MMFKRIDHTEFVPADFEKTLHFYTEIIGFKITMRRKVDRPPMKEIVFIELGGTMLELFSVQNPAPASRETWQVGYRKIAIQVEDAGKAVTYLKNNGIEIVSSSPATEPTRRAEIKDPDGISIELIQRE
ncbi:MAG: VOC family protein [Chloroflexi bacterium]|nr:VOC family protein [Chloroflexota bacterium]